MAKSKKPPIPQRHFANNAATKAQQFFAQGIALHQKGLFAQAQALYEQALRVQPHHFDALNLLGVISAQTKNYQRAEQLFTKAIGINPNRADTYSNRGNVLQELKQWDAALHSFDKAIELKPDYAEAYSNRGVVLQELKQWDAALHSFDKAIALKADYPKAYVNRGMVLQELEQWDAALHSYDKAIELKPDYAEAYVNRGLVLRELKQLDAALHSYDKAIALKADYAEAYSNRGVVLQELKQLDAALRSYDKAIALKADYAETYSNRGAVLQELKQWDAALHSFDKAIALNADYAEAHWNKSLLHLLRGNFDAGWCGYEWRWKKEEVSKIIGIRTFSQPLWLGNEPLNGKTMLLYAEQGLGDVIQFCRYAYLVAALGAKVILEVQRPLVGLLSNLDGVSHVIAKGDTLPTFDYQCPLLSLPLAFKTDLQSIPKSEKYLKADAGKLAKWTDRLGPKTKPRIGVVWSGSTTHKNDGNRSIVLADFVDLLSEEYEFVCLQKEIRDTDKLVLEAHPSIFCISDEIEDFSDTAALCELMDVVMSVDTSVVHLAGALGKKVWILLPYIPDWRWLLDRSDSPWYPTAKLYRQERMGEWAGVFDRLKADLKALKHVMPKCQD